MRADCLPLADVTISVDGVDLVEHQTEYDGDGEAKTASTFVETVPGAAFALTVTLKPDFEYCEDHLEIAICLDGVRVVRTNIDLSSKNRNRKVDKVWEMIDGQCKGREFLFAEHRTTDAKPDITLRDKLKHLGEVQVTLKRFRKSNERPAPYSEYAKHPDVGEEEVPEKALKGKAISTHTKLGHAVHSPGTSYSTYDATYPYGTEALAIYIFKYRSLRDLQIEGIVPRSPSPTPLEDRDPETLTIEEARELLRRIRARDTSSVKIKKEGEKSNKRELPVNLRADGDVDGSSDSDITEIRASKRSKTGVPVNAEVIDLSDD